MWAALLDVALGRAAALDPTAHGYATVRFVTSSRAGRLTLLSGFPATGPDVPFVRWRAAIGSQRPPARIVRGHRPGAAEVEERADAQLRKIRIEVEPHHGEPGPVPGRSARTGR